MGCFPSSDFSKKPPAHLFLLEALILSVGPFYPAASGPFFPARIGPFCPALIGPFNPALTIINFGPLLNQGYRANDNAYDDSSWTTK